jgi:phosphogluconate dehydratase
MQGNLGRAVVKTSAVKPDHRVVEAPVRVFQEQEDLVAAFKRGELDRDVIAVVRQQGPKANGMPELHNLTPSLGVLLDRGYKVALVTDGRMSGASGKVPAAIHVTPEAAEAGPIARLRDGDIVRFDAHEGVLEAKVENLMAREPMAHSAQDHAHGYGRELFGWMRAAVSPADQGACALFGRAA